MDARQILLNELQAIITASKAFVKRLRERSAHIHAGHFTNIGMRSRKLSERRDLLLPTFRRHVERLTAEFEYQVNLAYERYPELKQKSRGSRAALGQLREPTKSLKVSITLPAHEWLLIDEGIKNGSAQSRSEYFRKLHMKSKRS